MHRRSFASEGTLPKATRGVRKRVRGNAEAWVSTLHEERFLLHGCSDGGCLLYVVRAARRRWYYGA